jgi:predicted metal-dependent hydrolase
MTRFRFLVDNFYTASQRQHETRHCKRDGGITLNLNLAKKDRKCLEYVMIHELCHIIEFNHGKEFKRLMNKFDQYWKKIKKR